MANAVSDDYSFDEDDLLKEFEKMLNGETNNYKEVAKKEYDTKPSSCYFHVWEIVGHSPVLNVPWYNCKKCGMPKEEDDKK